MDELVRKTVRQFRPYEAPYQLDGIKLDANENIYKVNDSITEHMAKWVLQMPINYYPDTKQTKLREALARKYGVSEQMITVGVGSDQLIDCILRTFVEKGDYVISPDPSFSMYELGVALNEGQLIKVPLNEDFSYNVEALEQAIYKYRPKVTFVCHPNNPTGTIMCLEGMEKIIQASTGIVIIDEAYGEFCETSGINFIDKYKHVVVLRTFSKAYGLAGARVGYAIGDATCIEWINAVKPPYALNTFSEEVAHYMITHPELSHEMIEEIKQTREWVSGQLEGLGIEVWPSQTNFLWLRTDLPLKKSLRAKKIYIKQWSDEYYRMSLGTREQMEEVVRNIAQVKEVRDESDTN